MPGHLLVRKNMPTFSTFSDLLPDPINKIDTAGVSNATGSPGPGFASVKFRSSRQTQVGRTISGRGVMASPGYHAWEFDISYNPLTRSEFEPVASFLESREGRLRPFYVVLPQHNKPQDPLFYKYCTDHPTGITASETPAGSSSFMITGGTGMSEGEARSPSPGDYLNIIDSTDVNHVKTYKVIRVETNSYYREGTTRPTAMQRRIHVTPPLTRNVAAGAIVSFLNPKFRVFQKGDVLEYDLNTDNLYQFSLSLEEILP